MHPKFLPSTVRGSLLSIFILLAAGGAPAQENRTVDGEELGVSNWYAITLEESEFRGSREAGAFAILRNELPDRIQESWRHPSNKPHGPLVTMFYERLHGNFFAASMFESDFRSVFNSAFAARGVNISDARVVTLSTGAKAAFISYASTRCVFVMRVFGPVAGSEALSNGDRNARLFVCQKGTADDALLNDLALSLLAVLRQDGREIGVPGPAARPLGSLIERLFTPEEAA